MSLWKSTMDYLGLGPDDAYDDYDDQDEYEPAPRQPRSAARPAARAVARRRSALADGVDGPSSGRAGSPDFPSRDFDPSRPRRAHRDQ